MVERRVDPRTSKPYSVANLMRIRAERAQAIVAVAGTPEGYVLGSSRDRKDKQAERLAAHVSQALFGQGGRDWIALQGKQWPNHRVLAMRVEAEEGPAFVAALLDERSSLDVEDLARSLKRILDEQVAVGVAA